MPAYQDKDTKTWFVKCYYTDHTGARQQKKKRGFKLQRDAKKWESEFLSAYKFDNKTTFGTVWEQFMEEMRPRQRITTQRGYESSGKHILPTFKDIPVGDIKEQQIILWQNEMMEKEYSDIYLNKIDSMFRTAYRFGMKRCKLPFDIFSDIKKMGRQTKRTEFWTHDQYKAFYAVICKHVQGPVPKMAFQMLFYCGLRIGELLALTAGDVDLDNHIIHITKSLQRIHRQDVITPPKTAKGTRDIAMPIFLTAELKDYMGHIYGCNSDSRLFNISKTVLYYPMRIYCDTANVPKIRLHDLRHSHVAHLIEKGVSPMAISERLGHESVNVTLGTYGHLYPNKQREIADLLDAGRL
jgi:integrase